MHGSVRHSSHIHVLAVINTETTSPELKFPSYSGPDKILQKRQAFSSIYIHICQHVSFLGISIMQIDHCDTLLWTACLCPPRIHMLKPKFPMWWYLEVRPLGGYLGHEGRVFMNGISALIRRDKRDDLSLSIMWGPSKKTAIGKPGRWPSPDLTPMLAPWSQASQLPELWEIHFYYFSHLVYGILLQQPRPLYLLLPWPCDKCCTFLHHNLVSVDWLYCMQASGPKYGSVTKSDPAIYQG